MKKRPHKGKKPDLNELAKSITDEATDESTPDNGQADENSPKKSGRRGGLKGGATRAQKLTAERRREIARQAALARWRKTP